MVNQTSIAEAYNAILWAASSYNGCEALVLQHDDLEITDPNAEEKFFTSLSDSDVGIVGVAGGKAEHTLAWWNGETVGHQLTDSGMLDFGQRSGDVAFVEGSIMVLSGDVIAEASFDQDNVGFHSYDSICATVRSMGMIVTVADVDTHHHTTLGFKSLESERQWMDGNERFMKKWGFA
jgi:hypothetical protein